MSRIHIPKNEPHNARFVWEPTEYLRLAKDPARAAGTMDAIERWRQATVALFPMDPGSREAVKLEAHVRQLMASFANARPLEGDALGNAMLTALAGTIGMVAAESVRTGQLSRVKLKSIILARIDAIIDHEAPNAD